MNSRTSRLLNRVATANKVPHKLLKKAWNATPRNHKHKFRLELEKAL